ncbi:MAG: hypothetical protein ACM3U2_10015 [Deltaproteobacteria bacterium]
MAHQSQILRLVVVSTALLVSLALVRGEEKSESKSRRSITTTEWPSLRGVLALDEVRDLLDLTDEEQAEIRRFVKRERSQRRDGDGPALPPLPPDAAPWQVELQRQERRLRGILGDERYSRIRQLQAQAGGLPAAFTRDDPGLQLGVTPDQRGQARQAIRAAAEKMADRFHSVPRDKYEEQARLRTELYESLTPQLTALLTDEQKEKWGKMTGEPADAALILRIRTLGGR